MGDNRQSVSIMWFRRDLRLHDNTAFYHALKSSSPVLAIFIFDTEILNELTNKTDARVAFIHNELTALKHTLEAHGSSLTIMHGTPLSCFQKLSEQWNIKAVFANEDYEPYARQRDTKIRQYLHSAGATLQLYKDQVIFHKDEVLTDSQSPYTVFTPYSKKWRLQLSMSHLASVDTAPLFGNLLPIKPQHLPSLAEIGFKPVSVAFPAKSIDEATLADYEKTRDFPALDSTSKLSVHLRFGTISIRELVRKAQAINETWLSELIWREFFMMILWHFPKVVDQPFKEKYNAVKWRNDESDFRKWCEGKTGYPLVDAGMRELNTTGYMHNRVRMVTASFLCKHLLVDWRWGERYFAEKLLDYDLSANNGNWQWVAGCGCDAAPYFRIFNPTTQQKKFDPELKYVKKWVPEYGTADYPTPVIEHSYARQRCLEAYKEALST
jgi:deoxyribodipyrimidine photo-lyase